MKWVLLLAALVLGGMYFGFRSKAGDRELPVYVTGAERMLDGEEIYRKGVDSKPFTYPPFSAIPFVPMVAVPQTWQPAAWFAVNFLLLLGVLRFLQRWASASWPSAGPPRLFAVWVWVALLCGRHVFSVFENQSHDLLVCGAVACAAAAFCQHGVRGSIWSGVAAGVGAAFKATSLLFLELFVVARTAVAAVTLVLSAVLLSVLPDVLFPRADGASWAMRWFDIYLRGMEIGGAASNDGAWLEHSFLNQGIAGTVARLFTPADGESVFIRKNTMILELSPFVLKAVLRGLQLTTVVAIALGALRLRRLHVDASGGLAWRRAAMGACGLVACGMVLLSPMSSKQHFCVLLLPSIYCADRILRGPRDRLLQGLMIASALLSSASAKGILGKELGNMVLAWGCVTWSTFLLLIATVRAMRPLQA